MARSSSKAARPRSRPIRGSGRSILAMPERLPGEAEAHAPEPARAPLLEVVQLRVHYGAVAAIRGVDLTVAAGEVVALLGGNGARESIYALFPILRERMTQPAGTLSGGEQQMLALGRALMARPRVLLLDEPSLGLAPLLVQQIFRTLAELKAAGITMLLVEQNINLALDLADRAYVLRTGEVSLAGSAADLKADYEAVAAAYLGARP